MHDQILFCMYYVIQGYISFIEHEMWTALIRGYNRCMNEHNIESMLASRLQNNLWLQGDLQKTRGKFGPGSQ
jgi:hypothetical protein